MSRLSSNILIHQFVKVIIRWDWGSKSNLYISRQAAKTHKRLSTKCFQLNLLHRFRLAALIGFYGDWELGKADYYLCLTLF